MKTTIEIKELNCNDYSGCKTPDEYRDRLYNFMNKKWYSEEELKKIFIKKENNEHWIDLGKIIDLRKKLFGDEK
jgi:hypothetical protein